MIRNHGTRTVETTNFAGGEAATTRWTKAEQAGDPDGIVDLYADAHRANAGDPEYTAEYGQADTFEYEVPGLRVVALLVDGQLMTVFTVADDTATRLHKAVRMQRPVTITYDRGDEDAVVRTVEPRSLRTNKRGEVYMTTLERESGEYRSYTVAKVLAYTVHRTARLVREPVKAPTKADLAAVFAFTAHAPEAGTEADADYMRLLDRVFHTTR